MADNQNNTTTDDLENNAPEGVTYKRPKADTPTIINKDVEKTNIPSNAGQQGDNDPLQTKDETG